MIGEYVNGGRRSTITISPVVPGALYRITASALGNGKRSDTPAVRSATTEGASECNINGPMVAVVHDNKNLFAQAFHKESMLIAVSK